MVDDTFFDLLCHIRIPTLEVLEFGWPSEVPTIYFGIESLLEALELGLPNLYAVGFAEVFTDNSMLDDDAVDDFLLNRAKTRKALANSNKPTLNIQPGVYYV